MCADPYRNEPGVDPDLKDLVVLREESRDQWYKRAVGVQKRKDTAFMRVRVCVEEKLCNMIRGTADSFFQF